MPDSYRKVGLSLEPSQVNQLDDIVSRWDDREVQSISRSAVAREALALGLAALEVMDDRPEIRRLHQRDRSALVRQAILDELNE